MSDIVTERNLLLKDHCSSSAPRTTATIAVQVEDTDVVPGEWVVVVRGAHPGVYPTRYKSVVSESWFYLTASRAEGLVGVVGLWPSIYNIYSSVDEACIAFLNALNRPGAVQFLQPLSTYLRNRPPVMIAQYPPDPPPFPLSRENTPSYAVTTNVSPQDAGGIVIFRGTRCGVFRDW